MTVLQLISGFTPVGVNPDGTVVVGKSGDLPARWSQSDSTVRTLTNDSTAYVRGVSSDGHVVIGTLGGTAARWVDLQAGQVLLNSTTETLNVAGVSKDGSIIVGTRASDKFLFRWKSTGITYFNPATASPDISNAIRIADLSDDGNLVAGTFGDPFFDRGFRWNLSTGTTDVITASGVYTAVQYGGMSADGTTIVGQLWGSGAPNHADAFS